MSSLTLNTNLSYIGISQAKGVEIPLLRDQVTGTVRGAGKEAPEENKQTQQAQKTQQPQQLTPEQQRQVEQLQATDRKVRAHEQAHISVGRELITSGPQYTYTYGPDGKQYATGGEVGIDTSPEKKPEANIRKGERIQATALAPAEPSQQDYSVAAAGSRLEEQGRADKLREEARAAQAAAEAQKQQEQQAQDTSGTDQVAATSSEAATEGKTADVASAQAANNQNLLKLYGVAVSPAAASETALSVFA